jgi:hypothetical protein
LTATEESEKVRDEVRRQREGEKLLIKSYKGYLKILEGEIKGQWTRCGGTIADDQVVRHFPHSVYDV